MLAVKEETSDRDKDGIIDVEDDTRTWLNWSGQKKYLSAEDISLQKDPNGIHDYSSWRQQLPAFFCGLLENKEPAKWPVYYSPIKRLSFFDTVGATMLLKTIFASPLYLISLALLACD